MRMASRVLPLPIPPPSPASHSRPPSTDPSANSSGGGGGGPKAESAYTVRALPIKIYLPDNAPVVQEVITPLSLDGESHCEWLGLAWLGGQRCVSSSETCWGLCLGQVGARIHGQVRELATCDLVYSPLHPSPSPSHMPRSLPASRSSPSTLRSPSCARTLRCPLRTLFYPLPIIRGAHYLVPQPRPDSSPNPRSSTPGKPATVLSLLRQHLPLLFPPTGPGPFPIAFPVAQGVELPAEAELAWLASCLAGADGWLRIGIRLVGE